MTALWDFSIPVFNPRPPFFCLNPKDEIWSVSPSSIFIPLLCKFFGASHGDDVSHHSYHSYSIRPREIIEGADVLVGVNAESKDVSIRHVHREDIYFGLTFYPIACPQVLPRNCFWEQVETGVGLHPGGPPLSRDLGISSSGCRKINRPASLK